MPESPKPTPHRAFVLVPGDVISEAHRIIRKGFTSAKPSGEILAGPFGANFEREHLRMEVAVVNGIPLTIVGTVYDTSDNSVVTSQVLPGKINTLDREHVINFDNNMFRLTITRAASNTLTEDARNAYISTGGGYCPYCNCGEVHAANPLASGVAASQVHSCCSCGAEWQNRYGLVDVLPITPPQANVARSR